MFASAVGARCRACKGAPEIARVQGAGMCTFLGGLLRVARCWLRRLCEISCHSMDERPSPET